MYKPAAYVETNYKQRRDARDFCEEFSDELAEVSGRCIDIGSGTCDVVADFVLPKLNPKASIVCSDISEPMVEFGKKRYKDNHRMSFIKLNIESPNLPENLIEQFDHVTSFYCLHWCYDMRQVFENIFNLLQPGGTVLLAFIAGNPTRNAYQAMATMSLYEPYMKDINHLLPVYSDSKGRREDLKALLKDVGFNICHFSYREKTYIYNDRAVVKDTLLAVNPFVERIPIDLREGYEEELVKEFAKQCIVFSTNNNKDEYNLLARYNLFLTYLKKPISK